MSDCCDTPKPITIYPYKRNGEWAFDDPRAGLERELLVRGTDVILDGLTRGMDVADGVELTFGDKMFAGNQRAFRKVGEEDGGNWYEDVHTKQRGWLCPALFLYFREAPAHLYVRIRPKPKPLMGCGHSANATDADGQSLCAICFGITPGATQVVARPDLTARYSKCPYCRSTVPSDTELAFFEYKPAREFDSHYCGCRGWD